MGGVDMDEWMDGLIPRQCLFSSLDWRVGIVLRLQKNENEVGTRDSLRRSREMKETPHSFDHFKSPSLEPQLVIWTRRPLEPEKVLCLGRQNYFLMA